MVKILSGLIRDNFIFTRVLFTFFKLSKSIIFTIFRNDKIKDKKPQSLMKESNCNVKYFIHYYYQ